MRTLALFVIGLVFGGGIGFVAAAGMGVTFDGHDHGEHLLHAGGTHAMAHDTPFEVDGGNAPALAIALHRDPMVGYNLHVMVENFAFAPEQSGLEHRSGQGHAHVYVNGVKRARLYGPWMHLDSLPEGEVLVEVTLNANNHHPLVIAGAAIKASATVFFE